MRRKYLFIFTLVLLTILSLSACSSQTKNDSVNLTFSEYYQSADDYEKIHPLLNEYFSCVQNAYNNSDKSNLNSFVLSEDYIGVSNQLFEISNDDSGFIVDGEINLSSEYLARLQLLEPFLRAEVLLVEKTMLSSPNEDWYSEMGEFLTATYSEYANGTGE
ncbi:MAG: hypothetical protein HDQ95_07765 [Roseburia sp.]|nr:hypothetical protein [Roseburia sp.]